MSYQKSMEVLLSPIQVLYNLERSTSGVATMGVMGATAPMGPMAMGANGCQLWHPYVNWAPMGPSQPPWPSLLFLLYLTFALLISSLAYCNVLRGPLDVLRGPFTGQEGPSEVQRFFLAFKGPHQAGRGPFL